jgi:hypothetical protein
MTQTKQATSQEVLAAMNRAAADIMAAAKLDERVGAGAAMGLLIDTAWDYLFTRNQTLEQVVPANYENCSVDEVIDWIYE